MYQHSYDFDEQYGLTYNDEPICDFNAEVIDKMTLRTVPSEQNTNLYLIKITYTDGRPSVSKWVKDPRKINYFSDFEINDSFLSSKMRTILNNKLLAETSKLPPKLVTKIPVGLSIVDEHPVYAMGESIILAQQSPENTDHLQLMTPQPMLPTIQLDEPTLLTKIKQYIFLLPGITEPLFFFAMFAVVKPFVEQLQIHCGFLLALIAPSGQLKTTLARRYCLWLNDSDSQEIQIRSSRRTAHILDFLNTMPGQNVLIDDLRKSPDSNDRNRQSARLDDISRYINSNFGCANVILTGETMENMGIFSCIDRIFQLQMPLMDAGQIQELQKNLTALGENIMPGIALAFAESLMKNYNDVLKNIQDFCTANIFKTDQVGTYATRTNRHAMFILLTEFLFSKYFCNIEKFKNLESFSKALTSALNMQTENQLQQLEELRFKESHHDYIADLYTIIIEDSIKIKDPIKICTNKHDYNNSSNAVFLSDGRICISSNVLKDSFFNYYKKHIAPIDIIKQLHNEGILEEEPGSKGYQKNIDGKKRYVINIKIWLYYLLQHNYPVSEEVLKKYLPEYQPKHK